jgi:hypothetical protein
MHAKRAWRLWCKEIAKKIPFRQANVSAPRLAQSVTAFDWWSEGWGIIAQHISSTVVAHISHTRVFTDKRTLHWQKLVDYSCKATLWSHCWVGRRSRVVLCNPKRLTTSLYQWWHSVCVVSQSYHISLDDTWWYKHIVQMLTL